MAQTLEGAVISKTQLGDFARIATRTPEGDFSLYPVGTTAECLLEKDDKVTIIKRSYFLYIVSSERCATCPAADLTCRSYKPDLAT